MTKISVIVPVYNMEEYLVHSIESLLKQTFKDFEIILINDGSTDKSAEICNRFFKDYHNISVYHKENGGLSSARNYGLKKAIGDWIVFLDSDDQVTENYLSNLYKDAKGVDVVFQSTTRQDREKGERQTIVKYVESEEITVRGLLKKYKVTSNGYIWGKILKNKIIDSGNIQFKKQAEPGEDAVFLLEYLAGSKKVRLSPSNDYIYLETPGSLITRKHPIEREFERLEIAEKAVKTLFKTHNLSLDSTFKTEELIYVVHRALESVFEIQNFGDRKPYLKILIDRYYPELLDTYKDSKGRGQFMAMVIKSKNPFLIDLFYRILVF